MKRHRAFRIVKFAIFGLIFAALFGFIVMSLWNWLIPALFGGRLITYWQAIGILILSKILFGGFRGRSGSPWHWRQRMMQRWEQMTPEEREQFRQGMGHCGFAETPSTEKA